MEKKNNDAFLYRIIRPIITVGVKFLFTPKIIGRENIPEDGRIILAGNHTSIFDCLLLISSTKRSIHFLAKIELWKGFKKIIFNNLGLIPVNRKQKNHKALEEAINYLNEDALIGIFPEGTTEKQGRMLPFKMGVIKMAKEANSKIIPFGISGKYCLFSRNLKIIFGKPIEIKDEFSIELEKLESEVSKLRGDV